MRPVSSTVQTEPPAPEQEPRHGAESWDERAGRLHTELERPARAMVRRAFRTAFCDAEIDDIYSSAWLGTLRALRGRHTGLSDQEIGKYLLTAVANQAGKELRRRGRKPTAPLELVDRVPDDTGSPEERAVGAERTRVARDLLASLPPRRRAVMLLRYGWGLQPAEVCRLVSGLSPRAYRKEITRGVDELTERLRRHERGQWCADREPLLKAYVSGVADSDQRRQARAHLSHCNECSDLVARLGSHLHDLGAAAVLPLAVDGIDGGISLGDRIAEAGERAREAASALVSRGGDAAPEAAANLTAAGGTRGVAGAAGAGMLAKLAGIGTTGKLVAACLTGGAAATACLSAVMIPAIGPADASIDRERAAPYGLAKPAPVRNRTPHPSEPAPAPPPTRDAEKPPPAPVIEDEGPVEAQPVAGEPVAVTTPPVQREFGVAAAAAPSGSGGGGSSASGGGGGGGGGAVRREFGP